MVKSQSKESAPKNEAPVQAESTTSQKKGGGRGNAATQERVAALGGGGEGEPTEGGNIDFGAFLARMERAYGTSFSGVDVKQGKDAATKVPAGAAATTVGNTIYLGALFESLPPQRQEHVVAHELAHVRQQKGDAPKADRANAEADADNAASTALSGGTPDVQAGINPGDPHNFSLGDAWDATGGKVVSAVGDGLEAAGEWALEKIADVGMLLSYVAKFGEAAGRKAIDFLVTHKVEIVVSLLTASPGAGLLVYAIKKLPTEKLSEWMRSVDAKTVAKIVAIAIGAGAIMVVGVPLLALGMTAMPILKELSGPMLVLLWKALPDKMKTFLRTKLTELWPIGLGLALDGSIGATFGYPVYLGAEAFFEVSHFNAANFKLRRGGILKVAADTGVGAGGFIGLGGDSKKGGGGGGSGSGGGQLGIGAEAGANVQAGVKMMVIQEFDFPTADDNAFISFCTAVLQLDQSASMSVLSLLSTDFRKVNPLSYNTSTKFEVKGYGEANASASAGLRTGGDNTQQGTSTWNTQDGKADTGTANWWQRWMQVGIFGKLTAEAGMGVEVKNSDFVNDKDGVRVPGKMEVALYGEASVGASIASAVPVIGAALPNFNWAPGVGLRAKWQLSGAPGDKEPTIQGPTWEIYGKSGNDDRYAGNFSETAFEVGNLDPKTFTSVESFLGNIKSGATFKRRQMIGGPIGSRFTRLAERQGTFTSMLPKEYTAYGFKIEGYIDLEAKITADQVREIFRAIASIGAKYQKGGEPLRQLFMDIITFLSTGKGPQEVMGQLERIANVVLSGLNKLHAHGLVGLSAAAGGQVSAGAKVRLHGSVGAQITMDYNLLELVTKEGAVTVEDIKQLITNATNGASSVEVKGTGNS